MPLIQVTKAFTLTLEDHSQRFFKEGEYDVEETLADHWYVKAHSKRIAEPPPSAEAPPFEADEPVPEKPPPPKPPKK